MANYESESEYEDANDIEKYAHTSEKFLRYKKSTLELRSPKLKDIHCEYYYLENQNVKKFCKQIKTYGSNLKIDINHVEKLYIDLLQDQEPYFVNHIAIVEYNQYEVDNIENLLEVIDGHHRILALQKLFENDPNFKISIWIRLHYSDHPESQLTRKLFRKYNSLKPFIVDINVSEISSDIIQALNKKFSDGVYIPIKDDKYVRRPSICKSNINNVIQKQLEKLKKNEKLNIDLDINKIIEKFAHYNTLFSSKPIEWFNDNLNEFNDREISSNMYKIANTNKFYLGLIDLDVLVKKCIF